VRTPAGATECRDCRGPRIGLLEFLRQSLEEINERLSSAYAENSTRRQEYGTSDLNECIMNANQELSTILRWPIVAY